MTLPPVVPITKTLLHPVYRFKSWLEGFARRPHASLALFCCAFIEASLFPLPPDVLLLALGVTNPRRSVFFSLIAVAGSSFGALLGYSIGRVFFDAAGENLLALLGATSQFQTVLTHYHGNIWLVLLLAGFTPIPFMVFTIAAGFNATVEPATLFAAVLCGRVVRFVPIGILLRIFGPKVKYYFDHYFGRAVLVTGAVIIVFFIMSKRLF